MKFLLAPQAPGLDGDFRPAMGASAGPLFQPGAGGLVDERFGDLVRGTGQVFGREVDFGEWARRLLLECCAWDDRKTTKVLCGKNETVPRPLIPAGPGSGRWKLREVEGKFEEVGAIVPPSGRPKQGEQTEGARTRGQDALCRTERSLLQ